MAEQKTGVVKVSTLAKLFNLTERRVQQLAKDEIIPRASRGNYDLIGCVRAYIEFLQSAVAGTHEQSIDSHKENARHKKLQADKLQLEIDEHKGKLIDMDAVIESTSKMVLAFRAKLLSIPTKGAPRLKGCSTLPQIRSELEDLIHDALTELSELRAEDFDVSIDDNESAKATAEVNPKRVGRQKKKTKSRSKRGARTVANKSR